VNTQLAESTLELADKDLKSFRKTADLSQLRFDKAPSAMRDCLKVRLQLPISDNCWVTNPFLPNTTWQGRLTINP
jgi:hypothetical protein